MVPRLLALLLAVALASGGLGCFVFEELEKGEEIMEQHGGGLAPGGRSGRQEERSRDDTSQRYGSEDEGGFDLEAWWRKARTIAPGGGDDEEGGEAAVVLCRLRGEERFMSRADCLGRGGTPSG